jgi:hypothetical protein
VNYILLLLTVKLINYSSLHPTHPWLATTSGQRHNETDDDDDDEHILHTTDVSLKLWKII